MERIESSSEAHIHARAPNCDRFPMHFIRDLDLGGTLVRSHEIQYIALQQSLVRCQQSSHSIS